MGRETSRATKKERDDEREVEGKYIQEKTKNKTRGQQGREITRREKVPFTLGACMRKESEKGEKKL